MADILLYLTEANRSPFDDWFAKLEPAAAARVTRAITSMGLGNFGDSKSVKSGVWESRINYGPGYRIYYGLDSDEIVILLLGGSKKRQQADIDKAKKYWNDYKARKRSGE